MKIKIQMLSPSAIAPQKMTEHSSGFDLFADLNEPRILSPGKRMAIPTGFAIEIPQGHEAQIRPRSGLALNLGLTVLNSPGTIDADYRGEVMVILYNAGEEEVAIQGGMRVAQMVIAPVISCTLTETEVLSASERSDGGFGHTGH
jgi:dUTP pyrophosphatase